MAKDGMASGLSQNDEPCSFQCTEKTMSGDLWKLTHAAMRTVSISKSRLGSGMPSSFKLQR